MTDLRNDLAKARDKWLASVEGKRALEPSGLHVPKGLAQYLHNRIESAFVAGWKAK